MVYGVVKNGMILLENREVLLDGTRVRVEAVEEFTDNDKVGGYVRGSAEAILSQLHPWVGPVSELEDLEREVQRMRDEDVELGDRKS